MDKGGDHTAAWRELVARLELPSPVDPANAPWPDRENLRSTVAEPEAAGRADSAGSHAGTATSQPESTAGSETPAGQSRVIRPASFLRSADPATASPLSEGQGLPGRAGMRGGEPGMRDEPGRPGKPGRPGDPGRPGRPERPGSRWAERTAGTDDHLDQPTTPDLGFLDFDDDGWADEDYPDDRYIPPPLPPQPSLDPVAKGAWTALFVGPGYLLLATILGWQTPGWAQLAAVIAFVAGFVVLISRLGDGPSRRDGPDQGAVV